MVNYNVILVDGSSYLFRAYHAMPPLVNKEGIPTGAVYGVLNMIKRLEKDYPNTQIVVVFDPKGGSFRNELYAEYKADRGETPDDLIIQIPLVQEVIVALGLPLIIVPGYEADDVIASLVALRKQEKVLISTLDKDLAQLVSEDVHIINTMHNKLLDPQGVMDKFGVRPDQIRDYLALIGDRSDNVPGISGVGPKTAAKWLGQYQTIEGIKQHQSELGGKVGQTLRDEISQLDLSYTLVSLVETIKVADALADIQSRPADIVVLSQYFKRLGFKRWLAELAQGDDIPYSQLKKRSAVKHVLSVMAVASEVFVACDIPKDHNAIKPIVQIGIGVGDQCFVIDAADIALEDFWQLFVGALADKRVVTYDAKNLLNHWVFCGIDVPTIQWFDVMLAGYVVDSSTALTQEALVGAHLDNGVLHQSDEEMPVKLAKDVKNIQKLYPVLDKATQGNKVLWDVEMPMMHILADMEQKGVLVDAEALTQYAAELTDVLQTIEGSAHDMVGKDFNLASPKQLRQILFTELTLPVLEKTPGGEASTAESVLQQLVDKHPLIPLLLKHRRLSKVKTTYADALPRQADAVGRIHGRFNQALTVTGRLSSANPNLQNIPVRSESGRRIRQAFVAPKGYVLLSADYSQIELRIMAHFSKDPRLLEAFAKGEDIHAATAANIAQIDVSEVSAEQRRQAKAVNFGLIYGMSAFGLAKQLDIERAEAQVLIDSYFAQYPGVLGYMNSVREQAESLGVVSTLLGRKLKVVGAQSKSGMDKQAALRAAINAPMQGSASDIIKLAMLAITRSCQEFDYSMTLQVHDELLFEVEASMVEAFEKKITAIMQSVYKLDVPLVVNVSAGENWESAH